VDGLKRREGGIPTLRRNIPIVVVRDLEAALAFYAERFHFRLRHREAHCAIVSRDRAELHLVEAHEGHEAETCRIEAREIEALYAQCREAGVVPAQCELRQQWWGERDFSVVDLDGNRIVFFEHGP
jgi:uncharacterized glyoxalase superfamily protein PhnB